MISTVKVEVHQAGQPRPYADSVYVATITFDHVTPDGEVLRTRKTAAEVGLVASALVRPCVPKDEKTGWWQATLEECREKEAGVWHVRIVDPYKD